MPKQSTMVNRPDAADFMELPPGVSRVEWIPDTRFPLCGTFVFHLEDYTIGYVVRNDLLKDARVKFVGLRQPHPLEPKIELRLQTMSSNPFALLQETLRRRKAALALLKARFKAAAGAAPVVDASPGSAFFFSSNIEKDSIAASKAAAESGHVTDDALLLDSASLLPASTGTRDFSTDELGDPSDFLR